MVPPRISLIPANDAPIIGVLARVRVGWYHLCKINATTGDIQRGAWIEDSLSARSADLSFDGSKCTFQVGRGYESRIIVGDFPNLEQTWWTETRYTVRAAIWTSKNKLGLDIDTRFIPMFKSLLAETKASKMLWNSDPETKDRNWKHHSWPLKWPFVSRLRDRGWKIPPTTAGVPLNEPWRFRPTSEHPELQLKAIRLTNNGWRYDYHLEGGFRLPDAVYSANFDCKGNLWTAEHGIVRRYSGAGLRSGKCDFEISLQGIEPPVVTHTVRKWECGRTTKEMIRKRSIPDSERVIDPITGKLR